MTVTTDMRYRADITAGSLKIPESRMIADLLLRGADDAAWRAAIFEDNVLQARSPLTPGNPSAPRGDAG